MRVNWKAKIQTLVLDIVILYYQYFNSIVKLLKLLSFCQKFHDLLVEFHDHGHFPQLSRPEKFLS